MRFVFSSCNKTVSSREFCSVVLNRKYSVWRVRRNGAVCVTSVHITHSGHRWHDSCVTGSYFDWLLFAAKSHAHPGGQILVSMLSCQTFLLFSSSFLPPLPSSPQKAWYSGYSLAGSLNFACHVVHGGRTFLRRVIDCITKLRHSSSRYPLDSQFRADILW